MPSTPSTVKLSVVIVSYNVCNYVMEGIESLYKNLKCPLQIILVDNNSTDNTPSLVKQKFPEVEVIANNNNVGFSAANNQGFEICRGEYVLMFNPDAALIDDSLHHLLDFMEQEEIKNQAIMVGPKLINTDNSFQTSCWKFPSPLQHLLELFFLNTVIDTTQYRPDYLKKMVKVDFISGACILMRHSTLQKNGGLDVNLFWMDDVDFCKRNLENGGINLFYPLTTVKHHIGKSSRKNQNMVISNQIISKLKFYKKHKQYLSFVLSVPILLLQILTRIPLFLIIGIVKTSYLNKCKAYAFTLNRFFVYLFAGKQSVH